NLALITVALTGCRGARAWQVGVVALGGASGVALLWCVYHFTAWTHWLPVLIAPLLPVSLALLWLRRRQLPAPAPRPCWRQLLGWLHLALVLWLASSLLIYLLYKV